MSRFLRVWQWCKRFLLLLVSNPASLAGTALTTASAILILALFVLQLVGVRGGPYLGILNFLVLPGFFAAGLLVIPAGIWWDRKKLRESGRLPEFPVLDFNQEKVRRFFLIFSSLTLVNIIILGAASFEGVNVMETTAFCGTTCHTVMQPEHTTYLRSPHARVRCVECHIGAGASWFVKSKLSGSWQVVATALKLYPRPIASPIHNLRPARETCEQCHWPTKFVGDRLKVITRYGEDEANTETKTVLLLRVGGLQGGTSRGIHWHVDPRVNVTYQSDEKRLTIYHVEFNREDGTVADYYLDGKREFPPGRVRTMDCVDCHNRPSHVFRPPADEVDRSILEGKIDRALPYVKKRGVELLKAEYASHTEAKRRIRGELFAFYAAEYPAVASERAGAIEAAAAELGEIYATNVFPAMKVSWGTYPNHLGHETAPGCFRCHDGNHRTDEGDVISDDCETCHAVLAVDEKDPEILKQLKP